MQLRLPLEPAPLPRTYRCPDCDGRGCPACNGAGRLPVGCCLERYIASKPCLCPACRETDARLGITPVINRDAERRAAPAATPTR